MSYVRVVPRDLFNEADLLKCMGRLVILLGATQGHRASVAPDMVDRFEIEQDETSGAIRVDNLSLLIDGVRHRLERPLNSRRPWPLLLVSSRIDPDMEDVEVFTGDGEFTTDMLAAIGIRGS